jgi:hypothetical protein
MDGILSLIEGDDSSKEKALAHVVQAWQTPEVNISMCIYVFVCIYLCICYSHKYV